MSPRAASPLPSGNTISRLRRNVGSSPLALVSPDPAVSVRRSPRISQAHNVAASSNRRESNPSAVSLDRPPLRSGLSMELSSSRRGSSPRLAPARTRNVARRETNLSAVSPSPHPRSRPSSLPQDPDSSLELPPPPPPADASYLALVVSNLPISVQRECLRRSPRLWPAEDERKRPRESTVVKSPVKKLRVAHHYNPSTVQDKGRSKKKSGNGDGAPRLVGDPLPEDEARRRWPWRFPNQVQQVKSKGIKPDDDDEDVLVTDVKCHYSQADIGGCILNLSDFVFVKGDKWELNYVGQILEFFKTMGDEEYFRVRWLYRAEDTIMKGEGASHDKRRLFLSDLMNDNFLDCIVSKVNVIQIEPRVRLSKPIPPCDFYYDMKYSVDYSSFSTLVNDSDLLHSGSPNTVCIKGLEPDFNQIYGDSPSRSALTLLDIYSGCGGMSTGLCLGAISSGVELRTRWAIDINKSACDSLKLNHPETQIRNESAEDFLDLLKEWDKLCSQYAPKTAGIKARKNSKIFSGGQDSKYENMVPPGELEVASLVDICYGDPCKTGKRCLNFLVRWSGYGPSEDTWEPFEGLHSCQNRVQEFVLKWCEKKLLPRPGDVDVICGGPPCQGISGYNRFRIENSPLDDERNRQIIVFMDIVNFLKPKYVLMENVVDILRFADGSLGRQALGCLVKMNYQARLGIMAAGCYGLPQFRLRVFLWGAHPFERLPQFPLPSHDVVLKYGTPSEFERNIVAYDKEQFRDVKKALILRDAFSDLPSVTNDELREEMSYKSDPETEFQSYIRAPKQDMLGFISAGHSKPGKPLLYDHRPLRLPRDDYLRVCQIPRRKGANFRDLPGVVVGHDNVARRDSTKKMLLPSGKPLVPDYALNFCKQKSLRPFGRLWWDETVSTVICKPNPRCQVILHPEEDRILTIRESARLQGFPDYYKFSGNTEQRYCQIGNAVAVTVARALGYALGRAELKLSGDEALMTLPVQFSNSTAVQVLRSSANI